MEAKYSKDANKQMQTEAVIGQERLQLKKLSLVSATKEIHRPACLVEAWGKDARHGDRPAAADSVDLTVDVTFPCVAAFVTGECTFAARMLKPRVGLGRETKIKTGSHPFMVLDGEDFLRVGITSSG